MRFLWFVFFSTALYVEPTYGRNPATTDYYLITAGPSAGLHTQGGHALLRAHDLSTGEDVVYNWGTFDFDAPNFEWKFYQGSLLYRMMVLPTRRWLASDMRRNPRYTLQDKLNLTTRQKTKLEAILQWWNQPENNQYHYHIWANNCSTKIRDILDKILQGQMHVKFENKIIHQTFRHLWQQTFAHWSSIVFSVNLTLNAKADLPISEWDRMFIPEYMRLSLSEMLAVDDEGHLTSEPFLLPPTVLLADQPPQLQPYKPWEFWISAIWAFLSTLCGIVIFKKWNLIRRLLLPVTAISWAIPSSVVGSLLILNSLFTSREYLFFPATLWLFWPIDFLFLLAVPAWLKGQLPNHNRGYGKLLFLLCRTHMIAHCLYLTLWLLQVIESDIQAIAMTMAPASLLIIATLDRLGLRYRNTQPSQEILSKIKEAQNEFKN
ncbi:MAG: DUF4105 domain-containing protein [Oligoflexales bacterium]